MHFDLLLRNRRAYTYEGYMARQLAEHFDKVHIPYRTIYFSDGLFQEYMSSLKQRPPRWIISFLNFLTAEPPFCDIVKTQHFLWLKSSLNEAPHYLNSQFGLLGLPTPTDLPKTVYLPHGTEATPFQERRFDTVCFSSLNHEENLLTQTTYGRLDLFGEHQGSDWLKRLPETVSLHAALPYTEHFSVLAQSKIVVLHPNDLHWQLPAVAAGCVPLIGDEDDLQELIGTLLHDPQKRKIHLERHYHNLHSWERQITQLLEYLS